MLRLFQLFSYDTLEFLCLTGWFVLFDSIFLISVVVAAFDSIAMSSLSFSLLSCSARSLPPLYCLDLNLTCLADEAEAVTLWGDVSEETVLWLLRLTKDAIWLFVAVFDCPMWNVFPLLLPR